MSTDKLLLHRAEERGQSRKLERDEVLATTFMSLVESVALAGAASISAMVIKGACGDDLVTWGTVGLAVGVGAVTGGLSLFFNISGNFAELREGLASWREAESYAPLPPKPQEQASPWRPPIPVVRQGDVSLLDMNDRPALPRPTEEPILTPATILEILQASIENSGAFSRRVITRLRLSDGNKVTRGQWKQAAAWLHQVGVLRRDPKGAYCLPNEISSLDDLFVKLPGLKSLVGPGRDWTGLGTPNEPESPEPGRGGGGSTLPRTLAERHRLARYNELDHSVKLYLRGDHGGEI